MDGGAWWAAVHGIARSRARLSDFTFTFHFHALEKEMATHSSVLAWRIPGTGKPGGLLSMGSHRVRHNWSNVAAAAAEALLFQLTDGLSLGHLKFRACGNGLCTITLIGMQPKQDEKKESESRKETLMWKCPAEPACPWNPVGLISYRLIFRETALQDSMSGLRREKNWLVSCLP